MVLSAADDNAALLLRHIFDIINIFYRRFGLIFLQLTIWSVVIIYNRNEHAQIRLVIVSLGKC